MAKQIRIGDIVEIPTSKGLTYAQFTLTHSKYGALFRILPGFFDVRPGDFTSLVNEKERFVAFFPLQAATNKNIFQVCANIPVPITATKLPLFKTGTPDPITKKIETWWLWDGEKEWKVGKLESKYTDLPLREIVNDTLLIERIETGWTPSNEV